MANQTQVVSAARFVISFSTMEGDLAFSELGGINSKVTPSEYIYSTVQGETVHTKQFGKTEPPTITLKRALDKEGNKALFAWHQMARDGQPGARGDGTLKVGDAQGLDGANSILYTIVNGWCQELTVAGMKAGDTSVATIEIKIACDKIYEGPKA
jgi:phage tail-like protein